MRSKCYDFRCGDDSKKKLKSISKSQSTNIKFEQHKICLVGEENENVCDICILESISQDIYLQKERKTTISIFDDKKNYLYNIEKLSWN